MNETTKDTIKTIRHFAPIAATVGWVAGFTLGHIKLFSAIAMILVVIGIISAFTVCPLRLLKFPLKCMGKIFKLFRAFIPVYGVADLAAGITGLIAGIVVGCTVIFGVPAIFTISKYYENDEVTV